MFIRDRAINHPYYNELPKEKRGGYPRLYVADNVDPERLALAKLIKNELEIYTFPELKKEVYFKDAMAEIAKRAMEGGYGVTAPNVYDEYSVTAAISAAEELNAPMILDLGPGMAVNGFHHFMQMVIEKARDAKVPVCANLDHGKTFEVCIEALREGCSSIMADRSELELADNIAQCAELANIAHICGASIEAEPVSYTHLDVYKRQV